MAGSYAAAFRPSGLLYTAAGWRLQIDNDTSTTFFGITEAQLAAEDFALL